MKLSLILRSRMRSTLLLLPCFFCAVVCAQAKNHHLQPLKIGDKVPEIIFPEMANFKQSKAKLSQFEGKPVILDFWASWCGSCLANFKHLDTLQRKFDGRVQILLVNSKGTGDTKEKVLNVMKRFASQNADQYFSLPTALGDTIAAELFAHSTIPHYVWINSNGIIEYITSADQLNEKTLDKFLNGEQVSIYNKLDAVDYDPNKGLFVNGNGGPTPIIGFQSLITGYSNALPGSSSAETTDVGLVKRLTFTNVSAKTLYSNAVPELQSVPENRIIYSGKDSIAFYATDWNQRYQYFHCYELITPPISMTKALQRFKFDLDSYFNVTSNFEDSEVKCFLLRKLATYSAKFNEDKIANLPNTATADGTAHQEPLSNFINYINGISPIPIIDATNLQGNISVFVPKLRYNNIETLKSTLEQYGLTIEPSVAMLRVFYIKQNLEN